MPANKTQLDSVLRAFTEYRKHGKGRILTLKERQEHEAELARARKEAAKSAK